MTACTQGPASRVSRLNQPVPGGAARIDTLAMRARTWFLSQDLLEGRATGSRGAAFAASYIEAECRRIGLRPAGTGGYRQTVTLIDIEFDSSTSLVLRAPGTEPDRFSYPEDFIPDFGAARALRNVAGSALLVGTGNDVVSQPRDARLRGAIAVTLGGLGTPGAIDSLVAAGAVAVIQLSDDESEYRLVARTRKGERTYLADSSITYSAEAPMLDVIASPRLSRALLAAWLARRTSPPSYPTPLGVDLQLALVWERKDLQSDNVACRWPGAQPPAADSSIVLTAHYDHLGIGTPDEHGDSIYNGFSDNAAGVAMLLGVAEAFAASPPARHSLLLLFFTGEERGLLGSDYYVAHPTWPLERMLAVINLDAGAPPAPPWSWRIAGGDVGTLGRLAIDVALAQGWSATTSPAKPNSDYFPFLRHGVPSVFLVPAPGPYEGLSIDSSQALRRRWDRYHQPSDEWHDDFPFSGLERYARYTYLIARALDRR